MTMTVTRTSTDHPYLVFDVESCGLHGEGFAVGWVVVKRGLWRTLDEGIAVANTISWQLPDWVRENVMPALPYRTHVHAADVRDRFWGAWIDWKRQGATLAADVAWPVEARFLAACVDDHRAEREGDGPYPLLDIASMRLAHGLDPLAEVTRRPNELPAHNPLNDARQSARLLLEALARLDEEAARG
jgi:hypothetical protein